MKQVLLTGIVSAFLAFSAVSATLGQGDPVTADEPQSAAPAEPAIEPVTEPATEPVGVPPTSPTVKQTARAVGGGVAAATSDSVSALKQGGGEIVDQGKGIWSDVLMPMWQRMATALPGVVKAIVILVLFWLVAIAASMVVRKLLGLTRLDDRAATDWGLNSLVTAPDGSKRSIESLAATFVKWLILLFGFVAFFQALDLGMVAGPLQGIVSSIVGVVPNLLQAAVILLVYWVLATLLRLGVSKGLAATPFDEKAGRYIAEREVKGEILRPSGQVGRLVFYVVLFFGLAPFLDALGQRALVAPLSGMIEKALAFLPNVFAAVLIFFIGHLIATVVREIATSFLAATGVDAGVKKLGLGGAVENLEVSKISGSIAYFVIIVPVIAAAVDSLKLRAVSEPVTRTLETLLAAVPLLFVAAIVIGVGYFLARIVQRIVQSFLSGVGFDELPGKLGLDFLDNASKGRSLSAMVSSAVMLVIVLLTTEQALATLRLHQLADLIGRFIGYLPQVVVALVVVFAALSLSTYVAKLVTTSFGNTGNGRILGIVSRYAILIFGFGLGLSELGVGGDLVAVAVAAILGGAALALGLAFGLGGRDRAKQLIEETETTAR